MNSSIAATASAASAVPWYRTVTREQGEIRDLRAQLAQLQDLFAAMARPAVEKK